MTLYEKILTYDIDTMAAFIYGLTSGTEERIRNQLAMQGVSTTTFEPCEEICIANNVKMLLEEVDDG